MAKKSRGEAQAVHGYAAGKDGKDHHVVGFGNLRVVITNDDGAYFAQALEIDYGTAGSSLEDAQHRFERGLHDTVEEHLRRFNSIDRLLKPVPPEVWNDVWANWENLEQYHFSQVSVHCLDQLFDGIQFFSMKQAA